MDNNLKSIICSLNDYKSGDLEFYCYTKNSSYIELKNTKTNSIIKVSMNDKYMPNDSETSDVYTELKNIDDVSMTSADYFSVNKLPPVEDTSDNKMLGGGMFSDTSSILNKKVGFLSETSDLQQDGGNNYISDSIDTLNSVSELQIRRSKNSTQLDLNIFKKMNNIQNGGYNNEYKNKLKAIGINSSSTSSMCG